MHQKQNNCTNGLLSSMARRDSGVLRRPGENYHSCFIPDRKKLPRMFINTTINAQSSGHPYSGNQKMTALLLINWMYLFNMEI